MKSLHVTLENTRAPDIAINDIDSNIRETMARLPKIFQGFLTWVTAQPLPQQKSKYYSSIYQVTTGTISLGVGIALSTILLMLGGYYDLLLVFSFLITVSGMRKLQVVIYHHCSHGTVLKSRFANFVLGEIISILLVTKDFTTYKKDHRAHHNSNKLLTYEDETAQDLAEIGLEPGVKINILWQRLLLSFISPFAHSRWVLTRIKNCFFSLNFTHNVLALLFWGVLIFLVNDFGVWRGFIVVWLIPLIFLYQISRMLRLVAEHRWPTTEIIRNRGKMFICLSTVAVLNGEALPSKTGYRLHDIYQLTRWTARMIFIHLFSRIFVLVGDTPCHDYHHRRPSSLDWSNYIYARDADKREGSIGFPLNYTEVWGLFNAIEENLKSLSESKI